MAWSSTVHGDYPGLLDKFGKYDGPVDSEILTPEEDRLSKAINVYVPRAVLSGAYHECHWSRLERCEWF